jgi:aspartyl-tRNA synthetase
MIKREWIENKRDFGKLIILTLRDCSDKIAVIAKSNMTKKEAFLKLKKVKEESCIKINGIYFQYNFWGHIVKFI